MNDQQLIDAAIRGITEPVEEQDNRPFIKRLFLSLRLKLKAGTKLKEPIKEIQVAGGTDY